MPVFDCEEGPQNEEVGIKICTKCGKHLPSTRFGGKSWTNQDGSKTTSKRSQCRDCVNSANLLRYHSRLETKQAHNRASYRYRIKSYGLTMDEYEEMLSRCGGTCEVCGHASKELLHIDHDHSTGKVRGLLCRPCNAALGLVRDSPERLRKLANYLEVHFENDSS